MKSHNAIRMSINPPSREPRVVSGPVAPRKHDDGSAWRRENGHRALVRARKNKA